MKFYTNSSFTFFRVFDESAYGFTLIFSDTGEFINALNEDGTEIIQCFEKGATLEEAKERLSKKYRFSDKQLGIFVESLVSKKILRSEEQESLPAWIDPSDVSTLLTKDAGDFSITFTKYLSHIFRDGTSFIDSHKEFLSRLIRFFPERSSETKYLSIDIGCGDGYYSDALKEKEAAVISTDLSFERLLNLKKRSIEKGTANHLAVVSNAECLPFKDNQFDFILCIFVLEHVMDVHKVIKEMKRIARTSAKFIISFPSFSIRETIKTLLHQRKASLTFGHFHAFGFLSSSIPWCRSMSGILKQLKDENIEFEHVEGINPFGITSNNSFIKELFRLIDKTIGRIFPFNRFGEQTIIIGRKK